MPIPCGAKALTPREALVSFRLESDDLEVALVAGEPQVVDPVALCFDDKGVLYVVESRGYPHPGKGLPATKEGVIARLEDLNGDGLYEKRTTFATGLTFPNGILAWGSGFFVTDAPDVLYLEDTDEDGVADQRKVILTGFGTNSSSEQLRVAAPTLGPDGWIYLTSGLTGAKVSSPFHPDRSPVETKRNDGRFHPSTFEYQGLNGAGQFGQVFDNQGRRFICDNRHPLQWVVFEPGVLERNPRLTGAKPVMNLALPGVATPLYPLSPDTTAASYIPKLMQNLHAGTFTSSCGLCFFTGNSLPAHRGNFFICEPAQNLVHCRVIEETPTTLSSRSSSKGREFMASTDQWFRPVFAANGPDGALYLCDMYRKYVDHPNYLPKEAHENMDFAAGKQRGRIWKITSRKKVVSKPLPHLQGVSLAIRRAVELGTSAKPEKIVGLAALAAQSGGNAWLRAAVFSSCPGEVKALLAAVPATVDPVFLEEAAIIAAKECAPGELVGFAGKILERHGGWSLSQRFGFLLGLGPVARKSFDDKLQPKAVDASGSSRLSVEDRLLAIRFLDKGNRSHLISLLSASVASDLRQAAIRSLAETEDLSIARKLLSQHALVGPETRNFLSDALASRKVYHPMILQTLEDGHLPVHAFSLNQRRRITNNPAVKERANKLFGAHEKSDRMQV
ncbi:MAG: PVC-type heme-binding CxxCH protein, partial [Opitutales bacterium]